MTTIILAIVAATVLAPTCAVGAPAEIAIGDTLTVIARPILSIPTITVPGGQFTVEAYAPPATTGWAASLVRGSLEHTLSVSDAAYSAGHERWFMTATVPPGVPAELYDLRVEASGGVWDTEAHAVAVRLSIEDDFYFVHITDAHFPTHLYPYQSGADTDTTELLDLRAVIDDINIMNPAFVLFTGDLVNEGELENYLNKRYYTRLKRVLKELDVPVYLTAGNHDIGGWNDTPPPAGTARRNWWRFFGWRRLYDPPPSEIAYTQASSFDYGGVHFVGIEAYNNYDRWRRNIYGTDSFTSRQLSWLTSDLSTVSPTTPVVAFYHMDFQDQLNLGSLGIDCALWGHIHSSSGSITSPPYDLSLAAVCDGARAMRVVRASGGTTITPSAHVSAGGTGLQLRVLFDPPNDGTHEELTVGIINNQPQTFEHGLVKFRVPAASAPYEVDNGELVQTVVEGSVATCYVRVSLPAHSITGVTISPAPSGVSDEPHARSLALTAAPGPNPARGTTRLAFSLASRARVRAEILTVRGRTVTVLCDHDVAAGVHELAWDAGNEASGSLAAGVYLYRIRSGAQTLSGKIILLR